MLAHYNLHRPILIFGLFWQSTATNADMPLRLVSGSVRSMEQLKTTNQLDLQPPRGYALAITTNRLANPLGLHCEQISIHDAIPGKISL